MRDPKFLNESGSKQGNWYLNRFECFEFYGFENEWKIKCWSWLTLFATAIAPFKLPLFILPLLLWCSYVAGRTLLILHRKVCHFHGYFLYPQRLITTFKRYEKQIDMNDFDSIATIDEQR